MSGSSFRSVFMVASCATAALGCYLVSLRVASERAALEEIESEIVMAQRDIRLLQTEIGTRGRLAQLERWNVKVLALSAPAADQFLDGGFALARLARPARPDVMGAPVVLASAPADGPKPTIPGLSQPAGESSDEGLSARELLQTASLKAGPRPSNRMTISLTDSASLEGAAKAPAVEKAAPVPPAKLASAKTAAKLAQGGKPARQSSVDPLAPLPSSSKTAKDSGKTQ